MKKNILMFIIIVIILVFIGGLTYYRFKIFVKDSIKDEEIKNDEPEITFGPNQNYNYDIKYDLEYSSYIVNTIIYNYDFQIEIASQVTNAIIYIDANKNLYIMDKSDNIKKLLVEETKFKTLYPINTQNKSIMNLYALTEDGDIYYISLNSKNILDIVVKEYKMPSKVKNFTNLKLKQYSELYYESVVVYCENKKMYDVLSGIQYNENILVVMNDYILYGDNFVSNMSGRMLIDLNNEKINVKEIIIPVIDDSFKLPGIPNVMFITKKMKLAYLYNENIMYESEKVIKKIKQDSGVICIVFEDNTTMEFNGFLDNLD